MKIDLLYLANPNYGGWVTFTVHLFYCLKKNGHDVRIFRIKDVNKKSTYNFGYGLKYTNININQIKFLNNPFVTAIDKSNYNNLKYLYGFNLVIHDPTELKEEILNVLNNFNVFTIRKTVNNLLLNKYSIKNTLIKHPFYRTANPSINKSGSVSVSRIDFDKNIDIILKANSLLNDSDSIKIYGYVNRIYQFLKLKDLNFDKFYYGKFEKDFCSTNRILYNKKFLIDMSSIKKDGAGTQYTFLEGIDNGCILVLNNSWFENGADEMIPNYNCIVVNDFNDLAKVILSKNDYTEIKNNAYKILENREEWNYL